MTHNFDMEDALASAQVERGALPIVYTATEGGSFKATLALRGPFHKHPNPFGRIPFSMKAHMIRFDDGREWDEHNGWRQHG